MDEKTVSCPYCGTQLPEGASFCPYCARNIKKRREITPPRHMTRRALDSALIVLAVLALALRLCGRPQVYDNGTAEVLYTHDGVTYQVLAGWMDDHIHPANQVRQPVDEGDMLYTFPQCLYVNRPESGANAKDEFMEQVKQVTAVFVETDSEELPWYCDEPVPREDYVPEAALVSSIHFHAGSGKGTLRWTLERSASISTPTPEPSQTAAIRGMSSETTVPPFCWSGCPPGNPCTSPSRCSPATAPISTTAAARRWT